jgi:hypothetical protein
MNRLVSHRCRTILLLIVSVGFTAACSRDTPMGLNERIARAPATPSLTWVSPQPCQIWYPSLNQTYEFGTPTPASNSACGIGWNIDFPYNGSLYHWIWWFPDSTPSSQWTLFSIGEDNFNVQFGPIEITFNKAVQNFTLNLIKAPTQNYWESPVLSPGHYMVALDSAGQRIDSVAFDAGGASSEKTLAVGRIRKVLLYPVIHVDDGGSPISEGVQHRASFAVDSTCPPVSDPVIDSPDFKAAYDSLIKMSLKATMENMFMGQESYTRAFYNPDTKQIEIDYPAPDATDHNACHVTIPGYTGTRTVWSRIHTHIFTTGSTDIAFCGILGPYDPQANGGSLDESGDWDNSAGQGDYIFTPEWIFRLPPGTPKDQRAKNPFRWKKGANGCFTRQPVPT